jgi:hypothetical protein
MRDLTRLLVGRLGLFAAIRRHYRAPRDRHLCLLETWRDRTPLAEQRPSERAGSRIHRGNLLFFSVN